MNKLLIATVFSAGLVLLNSGNSLCITGNSSLKYGDLSVTIPQEKKAEALKTVYTCPMHPDIVQDKAGKCPKCGMNLVAKKVSANVYTCPMHTEIVQDKPGKCPKCGMNLVLKEPEKKADPTKK